MCFRRKEKAMEPIMLVDESGKLKFKCKKCERGLRPNDRYCSYCGTKVLREEVKK